MLYVDISKCLSTVQNIVMKKIYVNIWGSSIESWICFKTGMLVMNENYIGNIDTSWKTIIMYIVSFRVYMRVIYLPQYVKMMNKIKQ